MLTPACDIDWSAVIAEARGWIARLVVARTGAPDVVDDVVQEVALAVTRSQARPTRPDEVAPWLCKIVLRQCALFVRGQVRQQRKHDRLGRAKLADEPASGDPIYWLLDEERREIVRDELAALDEPARRVLVWKYIHGLAYDEIGSRLGVSRHVAEYRAIEARKTLRRRLQARGVEGDESR